MSVLGYLENWVDVSWWDESIPGNCMMGCMEPEPLMNNLKVYSELNYGFTFLTEHPDPDQEGCDGPSESCPAWDTKGIYMADSTKQDSLVVTSKTDVSSFTSGLVAIGEVCRLARQNPNVVDPARCKISLGGWSDYARIDSAANAQEIASLVGKMVAFTFADGIDLDFEHLTPFDAMSSGDGEFASFAVLINAIREEFDAVADAWNATASARRAQLVSDYEGMEEWEKASAFYYPTNIAYLDEISANGAPELEISWTTRFNAFVDPDDPFNYLKPESPVPNATYDTDNEGAKLWPEVGDVVDTVNIMVYDGDGLIFDFEQILKNFETLGGVPAAKLAVGFEPGDQASGGVWEGFDEDKDVASYVGDNGYSGCFLWALNPDPKECPDQAKNSPVLAADLYDILAPSYPYSPVPTYSKVDSSTGWCTLDGDYCAQ